MNQRTCSTTRCTNSPAPHRARLGAGYWCNTCMSWWQRTATDPAGRQALNPHPTCAIEEAEAICGRPAASAAGLCNRHRKLASRNGGPTVRKHRPRGDLWALVEAAAQPTTDECIIVAGWEQRPKVRYQGKVTTAARVVWLLAEGCDPGEGHVLHTCHQGEQGCINRRHLYLGDHIQNMLDRDEAGHTPRGEDHHGAVLTAADVERIRARYVRGSGPYNPGNSAALAAEYGVTQNLIRHIVRREVWSWLK